MTSSWLEKSASTLRLVEAAPAAAPAHVFDGGYYSHRYEDIAQTGTDPYEHYTKYGWKEARDPHPLFNTLYYISQVPRFPLCGLSPIEHYLAEGFRKFSPHPLFDREEYLLASKIRSDSDALEHYYHDGWKRELNPNALFDVNFYLTTYPDVGACGIEPLSDYVTTGWKEGRRTHYLFDWRYYVSQVGDIGRDVSPLEHFLRIGSKSGVSPHPLFLPIYYVEQLRQKKPLTALSHGNAYAAVGSYLKEGWRQGIDPHPIFSADFYRPQLGGIEVDPLYHYLELDGHLRASPSPAFDQVYYVEHYPECTASSQLPVVHFLNQGWREGKNPCREFDVRYYLESYPEVASAGLNPLLHYIQYGRREGRRANPGDLPREGSPREGTRHNNDEDFRLVESYFDRSYYLAVYDDVRRSGLDPLKHYMTTGWHEFRNPSSKFNTATYLEVHKDVKAAGVNPLVHYAMRGDSEERITKLDCLEALNVLDRKYGMTRPTDNRVCIDLTPVSTLGIHFERISQKNLAVSLSHDDYLNHVGGVQSFVSEEQHRFGDLGYAYVHLSPVFVDGDPAIGKDYIQVSLDGSKHSVAETQGVMQLLGRLAGGGNRTRLLVIHSLINFDEEHILREILGIAWTRKYYWLHDYSAVCSETHLLRNGITFCGCPPMESMACFTCTGYKSRHKKEDIIRWLLHEGFTFVTPSEAARNIVTRSGAFNGETVRVVPHVKLERSISLRKKIRNSRNTVRVAYCGYPSYHKGWHVFERVVDRSVHLGQYRFFHFGAEQRSLSCVEFVRVESSPESPDEMVKALRDRDVDIVLIASPWPETFCFVAVESILAGCMIATTRAAGNVAAFASSVPHVVVFSSPEELVNAFASGEMAHRVAKEMSKGLPVFNAKREGTTAALEANCD